MPFQGLNEQADTQWETGEVGSQNIDKSLLAIMNQEILGLRFITKRDKGNFSTPGRGWYFLQKSLSWGVVAPRYY